MKPYVFKISAALLLAGALTWACKKDSEEPPAGPASIPAWDVQQARSLMYDVEFKGFTKGALAQTRTTTLELTFKGGGAVIARFGDAPDEHHFTMDTTGALTPKDPNKPYSPILDLLAQLPPQGLSAVAVGSQWEVRTPTDQRVQASPDVCIIQSRRNFQVSAADAATVKLKHTGDLRVVDNKAGKSNFEAMFGSVGGPLAMQAWTQWRRFSTGETAFSTKNGCLQEASYLAVILPGPNMDDAALKASPEWEELTIRLRP